MNHVIWKDCGNDCNVRTTVFKGDDDGWRIVLEFERTDDELGHAKVLRFTMSADDLPDVLYGGYAFGKMEVPV